MAVPLQRWIEQQGFSSNPFEFFEADRETTLSEYFVRAEWFDALRGDPKHPTSGVLFAPRGYGKSSHRLEIARICAADKRYPALIVQVTDYTWLLAGGLEHVTSTRYLQYIVGQALQAIWKTFAKFPARWDALANDAMRVLDFHGLASWANDSLPPYWLPPPEFSAASQQALARHLRLDPAHPMLIDQLVEAMVRQYKGARQKEALRDTARFAADAGFAYIHVLVDRVDEHELTEHDPIAAVRLIKPLISNLNIIEFPGIAFKFFLPDDMRAVLKELRVSRTGERLSAHELHWSDADLLELLARRLEHYSKSSRSSSSFIHQFQDLCESGANADRRMVATARSSPRQLIQLGRNIIAAHCQVAGDLDDKIGAHTLASVLGDAPPAENDALAPADPDGVPDHMPLLFLDDAGFIWLGGKKQAIKLTPTSRRLLQLLWQNKPKMLTTDQILDTLYTHEQGADALNKVVKRLRAQLEPGLANSRNYVDRVEGTGYRLINYAEQQKD